MVRYMSEQRKRAEAWREYVLAVVGDDPQVDICYKTGIDQGTISRWLRPREGRRVPSISMQSARAFAKGYGVSAMEAFLAAGLISEEEAGMRVSPLAQPVSGMSNQELSRLLRTVTSEVQRRLAGP